MWQEKIYMAEKGMRTSVDTKLGMSQQSILEENKFNGIMICISKTIASRLKEVILPL